MFEVYTSNINTIVEQGDFERVRLLWTLFNVYTHSNHFVVVSMMYIYSNLLLLWENNGSLQYTWV